MRGIIAGIMASQIRRPKPILATYPYPIMEADNRWAARPNIVAALTRDTLKEVRPENTLEHYSAATAVLAASMRSLTQTGYGGAWPYQLVTGVADTTLRSLVKSTTVEAQPYLATPAIHSADLRVVPIISDYEVEPFHYTLTNSLVQAELKNV
ncbi:hypothetical protein [Pseudomonas phage MYY9]|uniref:Tail fiber protein n=1 Tax=Pseudomonas phage MYY9 TaxID=2798805 RepID=A0A7T7G042_9CAUD|nr:hypothetical protein [Pseudomonas phage MYY9]